MFCAWSVTTRLFCSRILSVPQSSPTTTFCPHRLLKKSSTTQKLRQTASPVASSQRTYATAAKPKRRRPSSLSSKQLSMLSTPSADGSHGQQAGANETQRSLKVVVVGCTHGELDSMYGAVKEAEHLLNSPIDLIICPGDFQAFRNPDDLMTMAAPKKYREMQTFWKYYAGIKHAPVPTIFVGGNHEASNHLQEIPLGGLVAPNMYFLGNAGVVRFRGLRIAGISGVYVQHSYDLPRNEVPPYGQTYPDERLYQLKTVYRLRREDVERLKRLRVGVNKDSESDETVSKSRGKIDVCIGHDWPKDIWKYGDEDNLRKRKPYLVTDIESGRLGNVPAMELIGALQPDYWFAAHMHFKFPAIVPHGDSGHQTKFLALDKIVPGRDFLQVLTIPVGDEYVQEEESDEGTLELDPEWLTILRTDSRSDCVSESEIAETMALLKEKKIRTDVRLKSDFKQRAPVHDGSRRPGSMPTQLNFEEKNVALIAALGLNPPAGMAGSNRSADSVANLMDSSSITV